MKSICLTLQLSFITFLATAQAPSWTWVKTPGGSGTSSGKDAALDASGNVYVAGNFSGTAVFGSTTLTSQGDDDVLVVKYDRDGVVQWAKRGGGSGLEERPSIAADANGVYVTGNFRGIATFDQQQLTSRGGADIFIARYSFAGQLEWIKSCGSMGLDLGGDGISVDKDGNVVVTGGFVGNAQFDSASVQAVGSNYDIFIAKYTPTGKLLWVESFGGNGRDLGLDIATDDDGSMYATGGYSGKVQFGSFQLDAGQAFNRSFVVKINSGGIVQWAKSGGGGSFSNGNGIHVDKNRNVYLSGFCGENGVFGSITLNTKEDDDIFTVKYSPQGDVLWARSAGGSQFDYGNGVTSDITGNVFATGCYSQSAKFDTVTVGSFQYGFFLAAHLPDGKLTWVKTLGPDANGIGVTPVAGANGLYVTGTVYGNASFDTIAVNVQESKLFLAKIGAVNNGMQKHSTATIKACYRHDKNEITVFMDESTPCSAKEIQIFSPLGQLMDSRKVSGAASVFVFECAGVSPGVYTIQVQFPGTSALTKLIVY